MNMDYNKIEEKALKAVGRRSAWSRGVGEYVKELCANLRDNLDPEEVEDANVLKHAHKVMLNGAGRWSEYSWSGFTLVYNEDIAKRLCTPCELCRTKGGKRKPNAREEWLDVQARALYQAEEAILDVIREEAGR